MAATHHGVRNYDGDKVEVCHVDEGIRTRCYVNLYYPNLGSEPIKTYVDPDSIVYMDNNGNRNVVAERERIFDSKVTLGGTFRNTSKGNMTAGIIYLTRIEYLSQ